MIISLLNLFYDSTCLPKFRARCLYHLNMFKPLFVFPYLTNVCPQRFQFSLAKQVFQALSLYLVLAFSQKSQSVNARACWEFSREKLLCFVFLIEKCFFKLEMILLQKVFAPPVPRFV